MICWVWVKEWGCSRRVVSRVLLVGMTVLEAVGISDGEDGWRRRDVEVCLVVE